MVHRPSHYDQGKPTRTYASVPEDPRPVSLKERDVPAAVLTDQKLVDRVAPMVRGRVV